MRSDQGARTRYPASRTRVLTLLGAVALLLLSLGAGVASAQGGDQPLVQNTFTKWVTGPGEAPVLANMAGVVGGDVGDGTFAGEVIAKTPTAGGAVLDALYHFTGSEHAFTALVHVVQTGLEAVITGRVTGGWPLGELVAGNYTQTTCPDSPAADQKCFQGTLDILQGTPQDFVMTQTCDTPTSCTVTTSSFGPIAPGTQLTYTPDSSDGLRDHHGPGRQHDRHLRPGPARPCGRQVHVRGRDRGVRPVPSRRGRDGGR